MSLNKIMSPGRFYGVIIGCLPGLMVFFCFELRCVCFYSQDRFDQTGSTHQNTGRGVGVLIASADGNSDAVTVFTNNSTYKAGMEYSGDVRIWLRVCSEPDVRFPKKNKEVD